MGQTEEMNSPLVSIITPAYNAERFINESIKSVLNQTYSNWEMIIVDDCSTDHTTEVVASYGQNDSRIQLIELERNSGPAIARNTAMDKARGRFIAFLDSDDLWLPNKLERQLDFMLEKDIAFSFTEYGRIKEDGEDLLNTIIDAPETINYDGLMKHCVIGCLTVMVDTKQTGKLKMINIPSRQDYVLWLSIVKSGFLAHGLPEVLAKYRLVKNSISSDKIKMAKQNWRVYRKIERQNLMKSSWYFSNYVLSYIRRYIRSKSDAIRYL
jgi:teichuronic acid biosynthesis glycosyltransferase TuaG